MKYLYNIALQVQVYCLSFVATEVPQGYRLQIINGFVEELVVNDDPEYQWIDKIRTPRASNEARQRLFSKLSGLHALLQSIAAHRDHFVQFLSLCLSV